MGWGGTAAEEYLLRICDKNKIDRWFLWDNTQRIYLAENLRVHRSCQMKTAVGRNWYQTIHFDKLSCRQVSFSAPKQTLSREEHKRFQRP